MTKEDGREPGFTPRANWQAGRRELVVGACLIATAGVALARAPRTNVIAVPGSIDHVLPMSFGEWTGRPDGDFVVPPEDERKAAAVYDDQLTLAYRHDDGTSVMLLIAYARTQSSMLMVHRPESCYPGAGFRITADHPVSIPLSGDLAVPGRFISAQQMPRIEQVLYWTRLGREFAASWDEERAVLARQNLRGLVPDGALVRASVISADEKTARDLLLRFASDLYRNSGREGRALLAGPASAREMA